MTEAFLCDAIRTPIGRYGGALSGVRADDLGAVPLKALVERNRDVDWTAIDDVIYGCANQAGEDNRNVARMSSLLAGLPQAVPGSTVNRAGFVSTSQKPSCSGPSLKLTVVVWPAPTCGRRCGCPRRPGSRSRRSRRRSPSSRRRGCARRAP